MIDKRVTKLVEKHFGCIGGPICQEWGEGSPKHIKGCPAKLQYRAKRLALEILSATKKGKQGKR